MAPARRSRARQAAEDVPEPSSDPVEAEESELPSLKFNKAISWPAGRPIAEGELVKRLQALFEELKTTGDEDTFNLESLRPKLKDLVADRLTKHRNRGVQAYTAGCLVETLRIFAPNAPYTGKELKVGCELYQHRNVLLK
jgi:sister-chromatid-cohesion protein PDS5